MSSSPHGRRWTPDVIRELPPDGSRYECVGGALLVTPTPSWTHQRAAGRLYARVLDYVTRYEIGDALIAPADIEVGPNLVEPDLFVVPLREGRPPRNWAEAGSLLLVVEILARSTKSWDRLRKRGLYQRLAAPEYWIIDTRGRRVERWRIGDRGPTFIRDTLAWQPDPRYPPLEIDLTSFFRSVFGE